MSLELAPGLGQQRGSAVVEVAIVMPVVMIALFIAVQAALWAVSAELIQASASFGSEQAAGAGGTSAAGTRAVLSYLKQHDVDTIGEPIVQTGLTDGGGFVFVRVSASIGGMLPGESIRVSATRVEPLQEFRGSE
jgi:hypothetical protein